MMIKPKMVAYGLHSVIEGIGNAPQYKTPDKPISEREHWRRKFLQRETLKNVIDGKIVEKVKRGKVKNGA